MGSRLVRLQGEGVSVLFPLSTPLGFPKSPDSREGINGRGSSRIGALLSEGIKQVPA